MSGSRAITTLFNSLFNHKLPSIKLGSVCERKQHYSRFKKKFIKNSQTVQIIRSRSDLPLSLIPSNGVRFLAKIYCGLLFRILKVAQNDLNPDP